MPEIEFVSLIVCFTVYYFVERCLRFILAIYDPVFYEKLRGSRKDMVFFGISMGLLISAISTPFCLQGARSAWRFWKDSSPESYSDSWLLDSDAQICVTARSVLWVSELNRLDLYPIYVVHHTGSIISLLSFIYFKWPTVAFLVIYTTLISEIPGDLVWMVSSYIEATDKCSPTLVRFKSHLISFNAVQYAIIRGAGIIIVSWMGWTNSPGIQVRSVLEQAYGYTLLVLYALFCGSYILRQCNQKQRLSPIPSQESSVGSMEMPDIPSKVVSDPKPREWSRPAHLRVGKNPAIIVVPYGLFMGIGFGSLVFISLAVGAPSPKDIEHLSSALNFTLVCAVIFARLLSIIMEDGILALVIHPLRTLLRPGFWLHGGLFGAAAGSVYAYKLGYVESLPVFAAGLAIGLPLYEASSRVGCHTYGCCYGRAVKPFPRPTIWSLFPYPPVYYSHPTHYAVTRLQPELLHVPLIPIQLISATLFLLMFLSVSLPLAFYMSLELAGAATLICHTLVRLLTEQYRADYRGQSDTWLSTTGKMALLQAAGGLLWLIYITVAESTVHVLQADWLSVVGLERLQKSLFAVALGIVVYGVHLGEVGSWVIA